VLITLNHASLVRKANQGADRDYHHYADLPCMISLPSRLQHAGNTVNDTIDDADHIII